MIVYLPCPSSPMGKSLREAIQNQRKTADQPSGSPAITETVRWTQALAVVVRSEQTSPAGRVAFLRSLGIQRDGKIVAVGMGQLEDDWFSVFELARYNTTSGPALVSAINPD